MQIHIDAQGIILSIPILAITGAIVDTQTSWRKGRRRRRRRRRRLNRQGRL
jgi:hypothetical protein